MFLKKLTLENVRCFKHLELDFEQTNAATTKKSSNRKWTVILGENGTGKSTILRAAALVTCGSSALIELLSEPKDWIRNNATSCRIGATLETADGLERELSLEMRENDSVTAILHRATDSLELLDEALNHADRNYFVAGYGSSRRLSTERSIGRKGSRFRNVRSRSVATLFDHDAELNPLESWAMELDYDEGSEGLKAVRDALSAFMPGLNFHGIDKKNRQLLFKTPDGLIPLSQLSDGYQNVAAWVGDLLYRIYHTFENYKSPLKTRGLLIIDEVDLHLHPQWQRLLNDFLEKKLPNMQLLVTTHSPITAQQTEKHQLHYLKRKGKTVQMHCFDADPSNLLISQLLMTEAFGLDSDESKKIEDKKAEYRKLRDKKQLTAAQKKSLSKLKKELGARLEDRVTSTGVTNTQRKLLEAVQAKLQRRS